MKKYVHRSNYFYGNKVSDYGIEHGYVDYKTLARSFDCVLNNDIIYITGIKGLEWEPVSGNDHYFENKKGQTITEEEFYELTDEEQREYDEMWVDIFQYYIISEGGYRTLSEMTNEIVWYCEELDMYVWGVTHYGTSWDHVLTDIKIDLDYDDNSEETDDK